MEIHKELKIGNEILKDMYYKIILSNGDEISGKTGEEGKIDQENLIPGSYRIEIGEQENE